MLLTLPRGYSLSMQHMPRSYDGAGGWDRIRVNGRRRRHDKALQLPTPMKCTLSDRVQNLAHAKLLQCFATEKRTHRNMCDAIGEANRHKRPAAAKRLLLDTPQVRQVKINLHQTAAIEEGFHTNRFQLRPCRKDNTS